LIWLNEGRPEGREREHWAQAEVQLTACHTHERWINGEENPQAAHHDGDSETKA
jgi:hypothetical protein